MSVSLEDETGSLQLIVRKRLRDEQQQVLAQAWSPPYKGSAGAAAVPVNAGPANACAS